MMNKKLLIISISIGFFVGLILIGYGLVFDPFSIPFQDYEQLPDEVKLSYENKSENMKKVTVVGLVIFFTSIFTIIGVIRKK